ncbi:MAG: hypothetical protein ACFHWX_00735 [Bacteroidota bacterium]
MKSNLLLLLAPLFFYCSSEISKEKRNEVNLIDTKVHHIDLNRRVSIVEDDFHMGDSIYKIRGYFMDEMLQKIVGVLHGPDFDRDDYFYFENHEPIFSGHLVIDKKNAIASEYKYYYNDEGYVYEALFWEDKYEAGKQFPHEKFQEYTPNADSLRQEEEKRLRFFLEKLEMEGFEIRHLNENLSANTQ